MRLSLTFAAAVASLSGLVQSFPTAQNFAKLLERDASFNSPEKLHASLLALKNKRLLFDPLTTPIDVTGTHAFQPPDFDSGDQRGPCPGLNALANHGYLSHNGIAGFVDVIAAANTVFGMGIELITVLAIMGTVGVGNPLSLDPGFSIGGESSESNQILDNVLGLLGTPRGLDGSHNWIEGDSSMTRNDLYVTGDASTLNMTLFMQAYNSVEGDVITMDDLAARAAARFDESIAINPYFYYGPYTGFIARNAGYIFGGRLLSNHTVEHPRGGHLTKDVFRSFWGIVEENDQLVYKKGHEQIPSNWYRIAVDYGLGDTNIDLTSFLVQYPQLGAIGGNTGKVNTFAGINIEDITGGILNVATLLEGNNLICFVFEVVKTFAPNSLSTLFKTLTVPLKLINDAIADPLLDLTCPVFTDLTMGETDLLSGLLQTYPGANKTGFAL
ncbi:Chloroperoxidase [Pseudomassariella vexata]|uniref:Chloroperoxidase n=1 Tax=Pseudomassariella vexata TaxID=1141098 RepID=A0A1Y2E9U8_9PEZI|nr:Chloroperoxidase [Pseudomassariella vexata]ORY68353.1 Chloroperoxidase [Pseudomassariella vexata]